MGELISPASSAPQRVELTPAQLDLVWDMNRGLTRREFDEFIETSRALGLNPLKRQVCAFVVPNDSRYHPSRSIVILTTIAGLRAIADRSGTYRPDSRSARLTYGDAARERSNPLGIVDCLVTPYRLAAGRWHRVVGQVWWDEIAPIRRDDEGRPYLPGHSPWWLRPRAQIIKCAEAAALRAGWPESLANVYAEDEWDRMRGDDLAPSDAADHAKKSRLLAGAQPKGTILVDLWDGAGLSAVPVGTFHDRVSELIRSHRLAGTEADLLMWREQQRIALKTFFAHDRSGALDIKRQLEAIEAAVEAPGRGNCLDESEAMA